ncbi:beta-lactamase-like protein [Podospora appendiculata]|uniref:Beta-lactamase-like protein n=1 Tax=Podospora appendiculata TaxID=314037 RepID=A0AAE1CHV1_9PEZI|nr:beta-lactamase-like protein [Podospora appendiculata]
MATNNRAAHITESLLVCTACGTQFPTADRTALKTCFICDDPRQYVPRSGQSFTTLAALQTSHKNEFHTYRSSPDTDGKEDPNPRPLISITTTPKFAIGQRAILVPTPAGNVLWDCLTLLDDETIAQITELGGLQGIVISHPHYYSTHVAWAAAFSCPVYLAAQDKAWLAQSSDRQVFLDAVETSIPGLGGADTGVKAIRLGGHFPGSLVLLAGTGLLIADTLMTTPSGVANWETNALNEPRSRPPAANSFSFMWSIPNMIPLNPDEIVRMWDVLKHYDFTSTHGAFVGQDIEHQDVKARVLQSMQIQIRSMGHDVHPFLHTLW